jgi:SAM-dependent methyltransferase
MALHDPEVVARQYSDERDLQIRARVFRGADEGDDPQEVLLATVADEPAGRLLEVGSGTGELAGRLARLPGCTVVAVDSSPRMVQLTRQRIGAAVEADVRSLPFPGGSFDCAVAAWMLYHVAEIDSAVAELARVLRPGGRLVAAAPMLDNLHELWDLLGAPRREMSFSGDSGEAILRRAFGSVKRRVVEGAVTLASSDDVRRFVGATIERRHLAGRVPELRRPLAVSVRHAVFTCR